MHLTRRIAVTFTVVLAIALSAAPADARAPRKKKAAVTKSQQAPRFATHTVKPGETLLKIAQTYGVSVAAIRRSNRIRKDVIRAGQELRIPAPKRGGKAEGGGRIVDHMILPGESLGSIAKRYGTTVREIRARNNLGKGAVLRVGRKLQVLTRMPERDKRKFVYTIQPGDNFSEIAKRFGMSVRQLRAMNPRKKPHMLRIGDRLTVFSEGPKKRSSSAGRVSDGHLINGEQLPAGPGYYRRTPNRSWGTNFTIAELLRAIAYVKQRFRDAHDLAVEHISAKTGGPLKPHKSHQSGRDVDISVYFTNQPRIGPKRLLNCVTTPVDYDKTWTLLEALAGENDQKSPVSYIFWEYECQKSLFNWAKKKRKSKRLLKRMLQYPRGKRAMAGVVRHVKGHASHLHIRFKCPPGDKYCI